MDINKENVEKILRNPWPYEWTLQGLGMLRMYLDPMKIDRLHVWSNADRVPQVSDIHDHPWAFKSWVMAGSITNVRFGIHPVGPNTDEKDRWCCQKLTCGTGGCVKGEVEQVNLYRRIVEVIGERLPGNSYYQDADEIHRSLPADGTVSVIRRVFHGDTETARVFWRPHESWVSAEPRPATKDEIQSITSRSLELWF